MKLKQQRGFSLLEMLIVTAILVTVVGIVLGYISTAQRRFDTEQTKMDMTQESREFMDQIARDLHMAGYPHPRMLDPVVLPLNPWYDNIQVATGIVRVTPVQLMFEGDVNNDGSVDALTYELVRDTPPPPAASVSCPCRLKRIRRDKTVGGPLGQPTDIFYVSAQGIINSGATFPLAAVGPGGFAGYTAEPVFRAYDANGTEAPLPVDINGPAHPATGRPWVFEIRTIRVTMNVLGEVADNQTRVRPVITMSSTAKINTY